MTMNRHWPLDLFRFLVKNLLIAVAQLQVFLSSLF